MVNTVYGPASTDGTAQHKSTYLELFISNTEFKYTLDTFFVSPAFVINLNSSYFNAISLWGFFHKSKVYSRIQQTCTDSAFYLYYFHCDLNLYVLYSIIHTFILFHIHPSYTSHNLLTHINLYTYSYNCTHLFIHLSIHIFFTLVFTQLNDSPTSLSHIDTILHTHANLYTYSYINAHIQPSIPSMIHTSISLYSHIHSFTYLATLYALIHIYLPFHS